MNGGHFGAEPEWPHFLPFQPTILPDADTLGFRLYDRLSLTDPLADDYVLLARADRLVEALGFLIGAVESNFVEQIDAVLMVGGYSLRVVLNRTEEERTS